MSGTDRADGPGSQPAPAGAGPDQGTGKPEVVTYQISSRSIWQVIGAVLLTLLALIILDRTRDLVAMLIISLFFALAIIPLMERLHLKYGWKRGAAVGVIYAGLALFVIVMVVFLIPMMVDLAKLVGDNWSSWISNANQWLGDTFNVSIDDLSGIINGGQEASDAAADWGPQALGGLLGVLSTGVGLIFSMMTILLFTFYFSADFQRIQRAFLSWFSPSTQERLGWTIDQAIAQTGAYFYSRMILTLINGAGFFFTMIVVGMPVLIALPLALIAGFISEFIPAVGTYIGGALPVLLTLAIEGLVQALIVLAYVLIYQQIENYWLSPKLSAETMTLNGGVAFGAAIAGGAIAGPMGAFMALPIAALITSFITHYRHPKDVVYRSEYDEDAGIAPQPDTGTGDAAQEKDSATPESSGS